MWLGPGNKKARLVCGPFLAIVAGKAIVISRTPHAFTGSQFTCCSVFFAAFYDRLGNQFSQPFSSSSLTAHRDTMHLLDVNGWVSCGGIDSAIFCNKSEQLKIFLRLILLS
jgi:hypothetical protein